MPRRKKEVEPKKTGIERNFSDHDGWLLLALMHLALEQDVGVFIEFDTNRTVGADDAFTWDEATGKGIPIPMENISKDKVIQGPQGFHVQVAQQVEVDAEEQDQRYPTLEEAAMAGLRLLFTVLRERDGDDAAVAIFAKYINVEL